MQTACSPRLSIMSRIHSLYVNTRIGERITSSLTLRELVAAVILVRTGEVSNWQLTLTKAFKVLQLEDL